MSATRSTAERVYAFLLRAYPADFRAGYGQEMSVVFRDLVRERGPARAELWFHILADVARTAPAMRAEAVRARLNATFRTEERPMKPMGILAIVIGLLQIANATVELVAGGAALATFPRLAVLLAIAVALLLIAAGVALVRRSPRAATLATAAAIAWLVLVVVTRAVHPWMSIFAMLLAVVFPIALLVFVWMSRGRMSVTQ